MSNIYENVPKFESEKFLLRFVDKDDVEDLFAVYSDKNSLPFFNSDNCDGDNFYYPTKDKMERTIELFNRTSEDKFNGMGVLRLDLKSEYEKEEVIKEILELIVSPTFELFDCEEVITKVPNYAIERMYAASGIGFTKSDNFLVGTHDGYSYNDYWIIHK